MGEVAHKIWDGRDESHKLLDELRSIIHPVEGARQSLLKCVEYILNGTIYRVVWSPKYDAMSSVPNDLADQNISVAEEEQGEREEGEREEEATG